MSLQLFSDIQSMAVEIQTCHVHRPIIVGHYDQKYHNETVNKHFTNIKVKSIGSDYFISSVSFSQSSHSKFRFAVKRSSSKSTTTKNVICGFKIGASYKSISSEYEWYKTIHSKLKNNIIPSVLAMGHYSKLDRYGLVLSVDGVSLDQIMKQNNKLFNIETTMFILYKTIDTLSYLHNINIIHSDIKYSNLILMNANNCNCNCYRIGLIDFECAVFYDSLCSEVNNSDKLALRPLRGTCFWASVDAHNRKNLTKRSDLISLLFAVLYAHDRHILPWDVSDDVDVIKERKIKFLSNPKKYLKKISLPKEFCVVVDLINNLSYHETPNYHHIKNVLLSWLKTMDMNLIECGGKQLAFLNGLKEECYKEYVSNQAN